MVELYILGPAEIRNTAGELEQSFLAGPKRLALLTYLLLDRPRGFHRRDSLLPLFWPDHDQKSARNALSNMLYHIRKTLGNQSIINRGNEEVKLNTDAFWSDTLAFEELVNKRDYLKAIELYKSTLLKGFHVPDASSEFDQWLDEERNRFHSLATESILSAAEEAASNEEYHSAKSLAKKAVELNFENEQVHIKNIKILEAIGDYKNAVEAYGNFASMLEKEYGIEPPTAISDLIEKIQKQRLPETSSFETKIEKDDSSKKYSIAVLPFEVLGQGESNTFTHAIHGDILTRLSQIENLNVTSRTSVMGYKNSTKLLPAIGRELNVKWIITGEVQESDNRVQVNIRLIDAIKDQQVWAEMYHKQLNTNNLFSIQYEITKSVTSALKMHLTVKDKEAIAQLPTKNLEAFRSHAQGRRLMDQRTDNGMVTAVEHFRMAISLDPDYALAWVGLADALTLMHDYCQPKKESWLTEAEKAAKKAMELDESLAEAHASLGLLYTAQKKGLKAIEALNKAVEVRSSYTDAHNWLSWNYCIIGKKENALKSAKKAVELNPVHQESVCNLSLSWLINGNYKPALEEARRLKQIQPDWTSADFLEGLAFYHLEQYKEAIQVLKDLVVDWAGYGVKLTLALSYLGAKDFASFQKSLNEFEEIQEHFSLGVLYMALREEGQGLKEFNLVKRWDYWESLTIYSLFPRLLNPLRNSPHYHELLEEVKEFNGLKDDLAEDQSEQEILYRQLIENQFNNSNNFTKPFIDPEIDEKELETSIAVLPFKNLVRPQNAGFTEGLHGDLMRILSKIKELQVISRTAVTQYENTDKTDSEIGNELQVLWLLKGEIKEVKDLVHLKLSLINSKTGKNVWSADYQRILSMESIFDLQSEITKYIVKALEAQLSVEEINRVEKAPTDNFEAYRLYTQGRLNLDLRTEVGIYNAVEHFNEAIEKDPEYALAWSGLSDAVSLLHWYGYAVPPTICDAKKSAKKALTINPELGEAYASLGILHSIRQEGPQALEALSRAINLAPSYAEAHVWLGWLYLVTGKPEEAIEPAKKGVRLNPLTPAFRVFLAEIYLANGQYSEALSEAQRARQIQPEYGLVHYMEGLVLYHLKEFKQAVDSFNKALPLIPILGSPSQAEVKISLAFTHYSSGDEKPARELFDQVKSSTHPFSSALGAALFCDLDKAFELFKKVQDWSSFSVEQIRYFYPEQLSKLRQDKRFPLLIDQVNAAWGL